MVRLAGSTSGDMPELCPNFTSTGGGIEGRPVNRPLIRQKQKAKPRTQTAGAQWQNPRGCNLHRKWNTPSGAMVQGEGGLLDEASPAVSKVPAPSCEPG